MFCSVMPAHGFALFETAIGACGIAWNAEGVVGMQLPERNDVATRARVQRRYPEAQEASLPGYIQPAVDAVSALLRGEKRDLSDVTVDLSEASTFQRRLYAALRTVPAGATISYGELATRLGEGVTARDVGEAMGQNPVPIIVPCHSRHGRRRQAGWVLGGRRRYDEAAAAGDRRRADWRGPDAVRQSAAGGQAKAALTVRLGTSLEHARDQMPANSRTIIRIAGQILEEELFLVQ